MKYQDGGTEGRVQKMGHDLAHSLGAHLHLGLLKPGYALEEVVGFRCFYLQPVLLPWFFVSKEVDKSADFFCASGSENRNVVPHILLADYWPSKHPLGHAKEVTLDESTVRTLDLSVRCFFL